MSRMNDPINLNPDGASKRRPVPDTRPAVEARALVRDPEGWRVVSLRLPAVVVDTHTVDSTPPHTADVAAAKLEQWVTDLALGTAR